MNRRRRILAWYATLTGMLLVMAVWSFGRLAEAKQAAFDAAQDRRACEQAAARIARLRPKRSVALSEQLGSQTLVQRIEKQARDAGMAPASLLRVAPEAPRRVGRSNYQNQPTRVDLRQVTLPQVISFAHGLTSGESGLNVDALALRAPPGESRNDRWDAEITLSYLIYELPRKNGALHRGITP